mmetsp:Transcript_13634/g.24197  ORF Transcript_13634/g.24197 Transcript_13634/m.24197 type:complete len:202 (-) Transcript_13634:394-999(-)
MWGPGVARFRSVEPPCPSHRDDVRDVAQPTQCGLRVRHPLVDAAKVVDVHSVGEAAQQLRRAQHEKEVLGEGFDRGGLYWAVVRKGVHPSRRVKHVPRHFSPVGHVAPLRHDAEHVHRLRDPLLFLPVQLEYQLRKGLAVVVLQLLRLSVVQQPYSPSPQHENIACRAHQHWPPVCVLRESPRARMTRRPRNTPFQPSLSQ